MRAAAFLCATALFVGCAPSAAPPPDDGPAPAGEATAAMPGGDLEPALRARIEEAPGEVAVAVIDLETGRRIGIGADVRMHAASTMKLGVMLEVYRRAATGRLALADSMPVRNRFTSIADGSDYSLSRDSDGDPELYDHVGGRLPVRELVRRMIVRSSNLATNLLIDRVGADSIMRTLERIGAGDLHVLRGVQDLPAYRNGMSNTTTAAALARLLEALARCDFGGDVALTRRECGEMGAILAAQEFNDQIPAGLPDGIRVAHKTGRITEIHHDAAIVDPPGREPYVLVVMTRGIPDTEVSAGITRDLSRRVWTALVEDAGMRREMRTDTTTQTLVWLHRRYRVPEIAQRDFTHAELWNTLDPIIAGSDDLERERIGRSAQGRPLHLVRYGTGSTRVLLWSQMHGDESTATMALVDLFRFLADAPDHPLARRLRERLTVLAVPMLNPDGAERFERRNAQGIDVNRDARALRTPEARTLKTVRDRFDPEFGFNLHDQNVRTRVGDSHRIAAIALLAPAFNEARDDNAVRTRAKRVASVVRQAAEPLVGGHIARYDDTFNGRAFGDLMQRWGTSTVLIESGRWRDDPEKQYLRRVNFAAILSALDAIATGDYADADPEAYESLPSNGRRIRDLVVRGGTVVVPGLQPYRADLAINYREPLERRGGRLVDAGDLAETVARDTIDASGLYVHVEARDEEEADGGPRLRLGSPAAFTIRRAADPASAVVWLMDGDAPRHAPIHP